MHVPIRRLVEWLLRPDRAVRSAREAATAMSRTRVEREEVRLYLEERRNGVSKSA
jgi:hypothetical protein